MRHPEDLPEPTGTAASADQRKLIHELTVYQIELEMQNEELRRSHSTLEERGHLLGLFFRNAPPAIAMLDKEMRFLHASSRWIEDYRLEGVAVEGRLSSDVFPELPERWKDAAGRCLAGATERCEADAFTRQDGRVDWVKWEIRPWRDGEGEVGGIIIMTELVSDQKNAEMALTESGERYQALFRMAGEGIFTLSPEGRVIEANEALARLHGYTIGEMRGMGLEGFVRPEGPIRNPRTISRILAGEPLTFETEHLHKDGHAFPVEVSASLLHVGGEPVILCFNRDITERKRAERELRGSHALMERAEKMAQFGNWEMNIASRTIRASPGAKRIYGVLKTEWSLQEAQGFVLPEFREMMDAALSGLIKHNGSYSVRYRIKRPADGQVRDIHSIAEYDHGKGLVFGVIYDITRRHRLEAALESRVLALALPLGDARKVAFEDLFNLADLQRLQDAYALATGVASIITRPDGTPLTQPSNFTRLCGEIIRKAPKGCSNCFRSNAAIGRCHPGGPIVKRCLSGGLWDAGASISVGGHHIASWLIGQVRDPSQTLESMAGHARDIGADVPSFLQAWNEVPVMPEEQFRKIAQALFTLASHLSVSAHQNMQQAGLITELRASEARVQRMAEGLERRVRERTVQLESANREMEAFSYSVSHDLRAPLRSIDGFSAALLEDCQDRLDETGRHHLARIRLGARRMGQLIDDLLDLSKVTRHELNLEAVDLSALAGHVLGELAQANPERRVEVAVAPALRAQADSRLVQMVLENLLRNAWKFTHRQPDARIGMGEQVLPGGERAFFIRDNGAGFDMAHAGKLFNPFQRLHSDKDYEGTGIGLAIVQRIVHRHGGRVWAEAEPGKGASFFFTIPEP